MYSGVFRGAREAIAPGSIFLGAVNLTGRLYF